MADLSKEEKARIAEKIQKCMALAGSSNVHESSLAAEKAREILEKYNMTMTDVEIMNAEILEEDYRPTWMAEYGKTVPYDIFPGWVRELMWGIDEYFNVKVLQGHGWDLHRGKKFNKIMVIGAETDVLTFKYVFNFLLGRVEKLTYDYLATKKDELDEEKTYGRTYRNEVRASFQFGAIRGIVSKLRVESAK